MYIRCFPLTLSLLMTGSVLSAQAQAQTQTQTQTAAAAQLMSFEQARAALM